VFFFILKNKLKEKNQLFKTGSTVYPFFLKTMITPFLPTKWAAPTPKKV
jgi:hypothetical protein